MQITSISHHDKVNNKCIQVLLEGGVKMADMYKVV